MRHGISLLVTLALVCAGTGLGAPVAVYHMDETTGTIADGTGTGNDGAFDGGAGDYGRDGRFGASLRFRGGQEINCGNGFDINDQSFTIETWIKADASRGSQELIASKREGTTRSNLHLRLGGPGGTWPQPGGLLFGPGTDAHGMDYQSRPPSLGDHVLAGRIAAVGDQDRLRRPRRAVSGRLQR